MSESMEFMGARHRVDRWCAWTVGVALGVVVVGLPWGNGFLLSLDLIAIEHLDMPRSLLAMGPDIPRRAPLQALLALVSPPFEAATLFRGWMVLVVTVAAVGMHTLLDPLRWPVRAGAAILYATSPFLLTRLGVGHLGFATAFALLPWAAGALLCPGDGERGVSRRVLCWMAGFALTGYFGLLLAGPVLLVGLVATRTLPSGRQFVALVLTQTPWLLAAVTDLGASSAARGAEVFRTDVHSVVDAVQVVVGFGFWRPSNQLGNGGALALGVALLVIVLSIVGARLGSGMPMRFVALAVIGFGLAVASALPGVDRLSDLATDVVVLAPARESQRFAALAVFGVVVLAARGVDVLLADRGRAAAAGAFVASVLVAIGLSGTAWWGLDGAARGHAVPDGWADAAEVVADDPGTTLALPWYQYFTVSAAGLERGHHPVPFLVDGDVLHSHDLGLGEPNPVGREPREEAGARIAAALNAGDPVIDDLRRLDVRWIVALPDLGGLLQISRLRDEGLVERISLPTISVFEGPEDPVRNAAVDTAVPRGWGWWPATILSANAVWLVIFLRCLRSPRSRPEIGV